jgi:hypothetical protein
MWTILNGTARWMCTRLILRSSAQPGMRRKVNSGPLRHGNSCQVEGVADLPQPLGFADIHAIVLRFPVGKVASLIPCSRHRSAVFTPASCCFRIPMICSSVYRLLFIPVLPFRLRECGGMEVVIFTRVRLLVRVAISRLVVIRSQGLADFSLACFFVLRLVGKRRETECGQHSQPRTHYSRNVSRKHFVFRF